MGRFPYQPAGPRSLGGVSPGWVSLGVPGSDLIGERGKGAGPGGVRARWGARAWVAVGSSPVGDRLEPPVPIGLVGGNDRGTRLFSLPLPLASFRLWTVSAGRPASFNAGRGKGDRFGEGGTAGDGSRLCFGLALLL